MSFLSRKNTTYKQVLQSPDGKFLLAALLDFSGLYRQSFSTDPYQTAFNEGKRAVALHIIQQLEFKEEDIRDLIRDYRTDMFSQ